MGNELSQDILKTRRQFFIGVKANLIAKLMELATEYPDPTFENTTHPNDHVWIRVWDKFFEMEDNPGRLPLFKAIRRVFIGEPAHDPYYRDRYQVILELWLTEVLKGNWKPRSLDHPEDCWKGDKNVMNPGWEFLRERFYHKDKYNAAT